MKTARPGAWKALRRAVFVAWGVVLAPHVAAALPPLPGVSPPPRPNLAMRWATEPSPDRRLASATAFANARAVVGLAAGVRPAALVRGTGLRLLRSLPELRAAELAGAPQALASLATRGDGRVRYVEPVGALEPAHVRNDPLTYETDPETGVPYEWSFHQVGVDQALNLGQGDPGIVVGVIDSGISAVPDLRGKVAGAFWDANKTTSAADSSGHGTLVSSIVAANGDDGIGLAGFCGACRIEVYKAVPLNTVEVASGVVKLTDAHVRVINISLTGQDRSNVMVDALNYALSAGVLVVAASGDGGSNTVSFPASYLQAAGGQAGGGLAVGASDVNDHRASFSNWGSELSLVAPGTYRGGCRDGIIGAIPRIALSFDTGTGCAATLFTALGRRYAYANGTSFSAPEVAGVAALAWAAQPTLTNVQVANVLEQSASRPSGAGWTPKLGWGVLDAKAALESVTGKSSADVIRLAGLHVSGSSRPGQAVEAAARATWGDGSMVSVGATPNCRITVGGRPVRATASLLRGMLACSFRLPAASAGARVAGSLSLGASTAPTVSASFVLTVRRPA